MKTLKPLFLISLVAFAVNSFAAETSETTTIVVPKRHANVRLNPITPLLMIIPQVKFAINGSLDVNVNDRFSLGPTVSAFSFAGKDKLGNAFQTSFYDVGLSSNIFITGTTSTGGLLVRPTVAFDMMNATLPGLTVKNGMGVHASTILGYQWIGASGFLAEIGGGIDVALKSPYANAQIEDPVVKNVASRRVSPKLELALGWAF